MVKVHPNMYRRITNLLLLTVVGCAIGDSYVYHIPKKNEDILTELYKTYLQNYDKFVIQRLLKTEELICKEVGTVFKTLQEEIERDLNLIMSEPRKHLKPEPFQDVKMKRCVRDLEEDIENIVKTGVNKFSRCIEVAPTMQTQLLRSLNETKVEYANAKDFYFQTIDSCLIHRNKGDKTHFLKCLERKFELIWNRIEAVENMTDDSQCMAHFNKYYDDCVCDAINYVVEERNQLEQRIQECVGYLFTYSEIKHYGKNANIEPFIEYYKNLSSEFQKMVLESVGMNYSWINKYNVSADDYEIQLRKELQPYILALNKTQNDYPSVQEGNCSTTATKKIETLIIEGSKDYAACYGNQVHEAEEYMKARADMMAVINNLLPSAGNVAVLKCEGKRPQQIYGDGSMVDCIHLAWRNISAEWKTKQELVKHVKPEIMAWLKTGELNRDIPCGQLRQDRLLLDADTALYDTQRCLFGVSGDQYEVTTPPAYSTDYPDTVTFIIRPTDYTDYTDYTTAYTYHYTD